MGMPKTPKYRYLGYPKSTILGLVGAGGIGLYIQLYARSFQFQRVSVLTLVVILMVITIEQASASIRRKLR